MRKTLLSLAFAVPAFAEPTLLERAQQTFKPLPKVFETKDNETSADRVALGKMLYFEKRASKNQDISCNSCHDLAKFGVDGEPTSPGHKKQRGGRNSPTTFNAAGHIAQFWDGRAATVEEQALGPVTNPIEMAMTDQAALEKVLRSIPGYAPLFKKAFPKDEQPITAQNFAKAIGAFERTLVTPSKFDAYLAGDDKALSDAEKKGLETFINVGCIACHSGQGIGGGMFQRLGFAAPVKDLKDQGRFEVTKKEADKFVFRVPSLRNIAKTAPYMHDGSKKTLDEMVVYMGKYQLGRDLKTDEVASIVTFLNALTGELPKGTATAPKLPLNGKETPKPDPS